MKGIILAGGKGTRLYPMTKAISKQLLPIYDKPLIYYPLSILMLAGIRDILIISTDNDTPQFKKLFGDGANLGINLSYKVQPTPRGIADAFIIGENFIGEDSVCLILGDNVFYGGELPSMLRECTKLNKGAKIFGYPVRDPRAFGVVEIDDNCNVISLEEKPQKPKSNYAVPGLYFYDNTVIKKAKNIMPAISNELEITSINNAYLEENSLSVSLLSRGIAWLDTGTPDGILKASEYVKAIQSRQGLYISCPEEIAWRKKFIDDSKLREIGNELSTTEYGRYLLSLLSTYQEKT